MTHTPKERGGLIEALSSSLTHGGTALGTVPIALRRILEEEAWRDFVTSRGEPVHWERFGDFITTEPLRGLGSDIDLIRRIVEPDDETTFLLDVALGRKRRSDRVVIASNVDNVHDSDDLRPSGNKKTTALRRLHKDRPDLHAEVLAGVLTAHAAAVQAGFRPRTVTVPVERPDSVAAALRRHMKPDDIARLVQLLIGGG